MPGQKRGREKDYNLTLLHQLFWETRKRGDIAAVGEYEFMRLTGGNTNITAYRTFKYLLDEGRMVKLSKDVFKVIDPEIHRWTHSPPSNKLY